MKRAKPTPWGKTERAAREALAAFKPDPYGVAESYAKGELSRLHLAGLARSLHGPEAQYVDDALRALEGRLHAQYAYIRDTVGWAAIHARAERRCDAVGVAV